jgi:hypothetical protein
MTRTPRRRSEYGFVMVPVMILLVVALGLGLALLAIVDTQTSQGSSQRMSDAAQTLAEGVVAATANSLSTNGTAADWPITGACQAITGDLTTAPTGATTSLAYRVAKEVQTRFAGTSSDYSSAARSTTWKVNVCPVAGTGNGTTWTQTAESRWTDSYLTRTITSQPAGTGPTQVALWVRGQASVRGTGTTKPALSRAVASKVQQSSTLFVPPAGYAVGAGSLSNDLNTGLNTLLGSGSSLLGGVLGSLTNGAIGGGSSAVIQDTTTKIGVRCGLLHALDSGLNGLCLAGTLSGVSQTTSALGLGALNTLLGIDRFVTLPTWTMAPSDAIAAWKARAVAENTYFDNPAGTGNVTLKQPGDNAHECYPNSGGNPVVYIAKVGDGNQYCTVGGTRSARILIVEKGGVRITGPFTGVVYALNGAECTQSDGTCSANDRKTTTTREVVRIEGNSGSVTGQVWADGTGGQVGIYPTYAPDSATLVDAIGGASGVCGVSGLASVLTSLTTTLTNILGAVGNILSGRTTRPPGNVSSSACALLKAELKKKTPADLLTLYQQGGNVSVQVSEHQGCFLVLCSGPWTVDAQDYKTVSIPANLGGTSDSLVAQLVSALDSTVKSVTTPANHYAAITYNASVVNNAAAQLSIGAGPVVGTYRNIGSN